MSSCANSQYSFLDYLEENKLFSILTTFTFAVIFIFIYILKVYTFFEKRRIPRGVRPKAPFGNIKGVLFQDTTLYVYLWKCYNRFKRKGFRYGGLYLFFKPSVLVVHPTLMQEISSNQKWFSDVHRKKFLRDFPVSDVFNNDNLENFLNKYNVIKNSLVENLNDKSVSAIMHNFFMETTSSAFGFKTSVEFLDVVNSLLNKKSAAGFGYYFGLVYPLFQRDINRTQEMEAIINNIISYRKKNDIREKDLIQAFVNLCNNGDYSLEEIVPEIFNIFVDNIIYCYNSLLFCLYELASNKIIQQNLFDEIRRFGKENKSINLENLQQLSYLDAVVREALRKYPPIPTIIKKCNEDVKIDRFALELPKSSFILYSVMGLHHDPLNYPEPEKFDPERFLEENKESGLLNAYIPFGLDTWEEIGLHFTTLHIKLGLISILSSYNIVLNGSHRLEFDNKKLPVCPKEPLPVTFEPRSK